VLVIVLVMEHPKSLVCAQSSHAGEVLDAEAIQHFASACPRLSTLGTQWFRLAMEIAWLCVLVAV